MHARHYNAAGAALGDEFRVNTFTFFRQDRPAVAMDAAGNFVVAWESLFQGEPDFGIYAQRYKANEPPTTLGIDAVNVPPDSPDTLIPLFPRFADSTDPDFALIFSITANTNPALFSSTTIDPATGILTLDYAPSQSGIANLT